MNAAREEVRFLRHAPLPVAYPRPKVPMLPVAKRTPPSAPEFSPSSRFLAEDALYLASGAAAIHYALRAIGIVAGDEVLVPAYHCPSMLYPILATGAVPVIVPVRPDLSVPVASLEERRRERTRAVLMPHYFGFLQPGMEDARAWCDRLGITLIEDCAHAFYDNGFPRGAGHYGHLAICSSRKFFAGGEGGAVVSNVGPIADRRSRPSLLEELRGLESLLHERVRAGDSWLMRRLLRVPDRATDGPTDVEAALREAQAAPASPSDLKSSARERSALLLARLLVCHTDHVRNAAVRRSRFARWSRALAGRDDVLAWQPGLPERMVPYVYPVRLLDPDRQFVALKQAGLQVWRWDRLARSDCRTSASLACALIQLPCQQSLSDADFDALVCGVEVALGS